ncbi:hypothetical protein SAMN04487949_2745 [Halogranum gelatinilyticum]|uniref:Uncharacterized protein n=1 Tax=Halogranum gelatinilyticum TaxID=660521 RepID=A0A1G9WGQ8_9EURY|nr:hypothetical protein [Halogranum gelatinilyticum]SDM83443.1 hypothetical protein SAMN04487949_2745 [Halogranum gelatinilyticum]
MADTKRGRVEQARQAERRQRRRELETALDRLDESEPESLDEELDDESEEELGVEAVEPVADERPVCRRRGCSEPATFVVLERYLEETSNDPVEAAALLCHRHTEEEGPTRLDAAYDDYVFRIEPLPEW